MREFSTEDFAERLGLSLERFCVEDFGKRLESRAWREIFYGGFCGDIAVELEQNFYGGFYGEIELAEIFYGGWSVWRD